MSHRNELAGEREYDVQVYDPEVGHIGAGSLKFGGNRWAQLDLTSNARKSFDHKNQLPLLKAVADDGQHFSLCVCKFVDKTVWADYVVEGNISSVDFYTISVRYSDISEWYFHWQNITGTPGESITWEHIPEPIVAKIKTQSLSFSIRSEPRTWFEKQGEETILHECVEFIFTTEGPNFYVTEAKTKTHELSCLLSIVLGYPATIETVMVSQHSTSRLHRIHFPTFDRPSRNKNDQGFWLKYFIQQPQLEGRWPSILAHYFDSPYRDISWTRLAGMQRYEGFWEYKALGYYSILDGYLTVRFRKEKRRTPRTPSSKSLLHFHTEISKNVPELNVSQLEKIKEIASDAFSSKELTFGERFSLALSETDRDILKLVSLSEEAIRVLKSARNGIAHGVSYKLKSHEFETVQHAQYKLALLLTYWAYLDFGISTEEFIKCLGTTHSKLRFSAALDEIHLSRLNGTAEFFQVSVEKYKELEGIKRLRVFGCCTQAPDGELNFSPKFTEMYEDWQNNPTSTGVQLPEKIFLVHNTRARIIGHGYIECGIERFSVAMMWIITQDSSDSSEEQNPK